MNIGNGIIFKIYLNPFDEFVLEYLFRKGINKLLKIKTVNILNIEPRNIQRKYLFHMERTVF